MLTASLTRDDTGPRAAGSAAWACDNGLLQALPAQAMERLQPLLQRVTLHPRQVLYERNMPIGHAYFIERGAAALHTRIPGRGMLELGLLGRDDFVGIPLVLAARRSPHRCVVQVAGTALRIDAPRLAHALEGIDGLRGVLLRYVQARMLEMAQLAACNTTHSLQQRLARYLLIGQERLDTDELPLTHLALSRALGVRRAGVTTTIGRMEEIGMIRRGRGRLIVADERALQAQACDCYRTIQAGYRRIDCSCAEAGLVPRQSLI